MFYMTKDRFIFLKPNVCSEQDEERRRVTQRHPSRDGPPVDPEGHPGEDHHQHGGEVRLQHEEEDVPPQDEVYEETVVPT